MNARATRTTRAMSALAMFFALLAGLLVAAPTRAVAVAVGRLEVDVTRPGHAELAWTQVQGASGYEVTRDGNPLMTGHTLRFDDTSIAFGATYTYAVTADVRGSSVDVGTRTVQVPARWDNAVPTAVTGLKVTSKSDASIALSWTGSTDDTGVIAYLVDNGGVRVGLSERAKSLTVKNLRSSTAYTLNVRALDAWGNLSNPTSVSATTSAGSDSTAPSTPPGVKATAYSSGRIDITWGASSDGHSLAGYLIYRSDQTNPIADVPVPLARVYSDTNVVAGVTYGYQVRAYDSAGNLSGKSALRSAAPLAPGVVKVIRGPFLQQVDQTSARVTWLTNISTSSELDYTVGGVTQHVSDPANRTRHDVLIGGLAPNTSVPYSITYPSDTESGSFRTCGQVGDPSTVAVVGDFGGGGPPETDIATRIANYGADRIISVGDNVYPAGEDVDYQARFFNPYAAAFANAAFWTTFGNHEYYDPGAAATHANLTQPSNESFFSFDCGSVHTLVIDTEIPYTAGTPQYQFVQTDLASATAPWKVVVLHRPPYSSSASASGVRAALSPLFERFGVQLVFQGHSHNYERTKPINGVTYIVTGGGGNGLNSFSGTAPSWSAFRAAEYEYVRMSVGPTAISLSARRRDDTVLDSATLNRTGDVTAPDAPTNLHVTSSGAGSVSMAWDPANDDTGVTNYRVFRNGVFLTQLGNVVSFTDPTLEAGVNNTYEVRAVDAALNTSAASDPLIVSTGGSNLVFSDDFESGSLANWSTVNGLTVSSGVPGSGGTYVARETSSGAGGTYAVKNLSPTSGEFYARFRFRIISRSGSVDLMRFRNSTGGSKLSVYLSSTTGTIATRNSAGTTMRSSGPVIATGQWYTLEVHAKLGSPAVTEVWLDGVHLTELDATGDLGTTLIGQFLLGTTGSGTYDVAFDDVGISKTFI